MPRRRLTAQEAFVGVRTPPAPGPPAAETPPVTPALPLAEAPSPAPAAPSLAEAEPPPAPEPPKVTDKVGERRSSRPDRELAAALREAQQVLAARASIERLTLYLAPDISQPLAHLWEEVREETKVKIGKSVLAAAALRIVLADPSLRAQAVSAALREKMGP